MTAARFNPETAIAPNDRLNEKTGIQSGSSPEPRHPPPEPLHLLPGVAIGKYVIVKELGAGGMGVVYEVLDPVLNRRLALKVMLERIAHEPGARERFQAEAKAMASIDDDYVVKVYDYGEHAGAPFLVMPLLPGDTLETSLKKNVRPVVSQTVLIGEQLARGLIAVHAAGLIHRDIKPANIWLETLPDGSFRRAKLMDFGISRFQPKAGEQPTKMIGTAGFMAWEQFAPEADPKDVGPKSDLFSLGVVLYRMLTGRFPYANRNQFVYYDSLKSDTPEPAHEIRDDVPRHLSELVSEMLARLPGDRPESAAAVAKGLIDSPAGTPEIARPATAGKRTFVPAIAIEPTYESDAPDWLGDSRKTNLPQLQAARPHLDSGRAGRRPALGKVIPFVVALLFLALMLVLFVK